MLICVYNMITLGIDVGKKTGWASSGMAGKIKFKSLLHYMKSIEAIIHEFKPDIIVSCRPTRFPQVIAAHSKYLAIIELLCEINSIQYYEGIDSEMKKLVLNKGNAKKPEIISWANEFIGWSISEDEADALMFSEGIKKICSKN